MADLSEKGPSEAGGKMPAAEKTAEKIAERAYEEEGENLAEKELSFEEQQRIKTMLEREIEKLEESLEFKEEAQAKAVQLASLDEGGKIERLLNLAEEKGVAFAVGVARKMGDHHTLDVFHDILAKEGFYKKFEDEKRS